MFHLLRLIGLACGFAVGLGFGSRHLGVPGAIGGGLAGAVLGLMAGTVPFLITAAAFKRKLVANTVEDLHSSLHDPNEPAPNLVALELLSRGEKATSVLPPILNLLMSESSSQRGRGWAALTSAFPELAGRIPDYRIHESVQECRRKVHPLAESIGGASAQKPSPG